MTKNSLYHWIYQRYQRLTDKDRAITFARFLWKRFLDDNLFQAAASLAYTTVFALVPLAMVVFGVLSAFPVFEEWSDKLSDYVFSNFVPDAARSVEWYLKQFSASAGQLTAAGVFILVISLLITLHSIETTFNEIWRVASSRPQLSRFLVYWTVLTLGSMLAAASLAVSTKLLALPVFETFYGRWLAFFVMRISPTIIEFSAIVLIYRVVPHRTVKFRYAIPGALLACLLLEMVKFGLTVYLGGFQSYQKIYGTVAFVPIFLLWVYLSWIAILLGASLASSIAAFRYQPESMRLPNGYEIYGLLRLLGRFSLSKHHGKGLHIEEILKLEPILTDSLLQQFLNQLGKIGLFRRDEQGEWFLSRDLSSVSLYELYTTCKLRIPVNLDKPLPCQEDMFGQAAVVILNNLRTPLAPHLEPSISELFRQHLVDSQ